MKKTGKIGIYKKDKLALKINEYISGMNRDCSDCCIGKIPKSEFVDDNEAILAYQEYIKESYNFYGKYKVIPNNYLHDGLHYRK